jgi:hypothetical protein
MMSSNPQRYKPDNRFNWLVLAVIVAALGLNNLGVISKQGVDVALLVTLVPMTFYLAFLGWRAYREGEMRSAVIDIVLALLFIGTLYVAIVSF